MNKIDFLVEVNGLSKSFHLWMLYDAQLIKASQDVVSEFTIASCWVELEILLAAMGAEITAKYGHTCTHDKDSFEQEMIKTLRILTLNIFTLHSFCNQVKRFSTVELMADWIKDEIFMQGGEEKSVWRTEWDKRKCSAVIRQYARHCLQTYRRLWGKPWK